MPVFLDPGHEVIDGSTGTGKTFWGLYKIVKSFEAGMPTMYIDPKGEGYDLLLWFLESTAQGQEIWANFQDRIRLINPVSPSDYIVGFNAIEPLSAFVSSQPDRVALMARSLVSHIKWQSGFGVGDANRLDNILSAALALLSEGGNGAYTLAEVPTLFRPSSEDGRRNPFVESLLPPVRHFMTRSFWQDQWPSWTESARREWVQSSLGRVFQYLFDERVLATLCTVENATLDFRRIVDEGIWVFAKIPYRMLSDSAILLGNFLITRLAYACMQRPVGGRSYRLMVDETAYFSTGPLATILETSRAYNLWVTMLVQSLDQLSRTREGVVDRHLADTALNNCRYLSVFRTDSDARLMAEVMYPLTGQEVIGIRGSGDWERKPVPAEENEHQRWFRELPDRRVVFYDKQRGKPETWITPEVRMGRINQSRVNMLEARHLQLTGRPFSFIREELERRRERVERILRPERKVQGADFRGM